MNILKQTNEIGFDFNDLPEREKNDYRIEYLARIKSGVWYHALVMPNIIPSYTEKYWYFGKNCQIKKLNEAEEPKNFTGHWTESLFKIERV